jgi:hypothetical protein
MCERTLALHDVFGVARALKREKSRVEPAKADVMTRGKGPYQETCGS